MAQMTEEFPDGYLRTIGMNKHRKCKSCGVKVMPADAAKPINAEEVGYVTTETHECGDGGDARIAGNPAAPNPKEMGGQTTESDPSGRGEGR